MQASTRLKLHSRIALSILAIGLVLMVGKIYADSEPGAIPLFLVLVGSIWLFIARARIRAHRRQAQRAT